MTSINFDKLRKKGISGAVTQVTIYQQTYIKFLVYQCKLSQKEALKRF